MANWDFLKSVISDIVKENGNQEITGKKLNEVLNNIISNLGENATYIGIAEPTTSPGSPDGNVFYIARSAGAYSNFDGIQIDSAGLYIIQNKLVQNQEGEFYSKWILTPILIGYADTFSQNPVASSESNGLMSAEDKMKLDSVDSSIVRKANTEYYDHSVTDGPSRINTRANIKFLDANDNQLFNAVLFGAGDGYPGLLSLKNKTKLDGYADTFSQNPVASSESNGLMSAEDKMKLDSVGESEIIDLPWDDEVQGQDGYINNFTERGEYHIHGERLYDNDGLPILNAASGHTIDGLMTVLDSSLPNGNKYDVCVTQILRLNNRVGGDGHIYVRTGIAATKSELQRSTAGGWSPWEKLMGVFEKNVVSNATDLNTYTSSGIYDGMFVFSSTSQTAVSGLKIENGSTFLMVSVNGYAVAQTGVVPQITQLLYILPSGLDGSHGVRPANVYIRTGIHSPSGYIWNEFTGFGGGGASSEELNAIKGRLDTAEAAIQSEQARLDEVRSAAITDISVTGDKDGVKIVTENTLVSAGGDIKIPNADPRNNTAGVVTSEEINALYEIDLAAADVTNIGFEKDAEKNKITLTGIGQLGDYQSNEIELTPATSELAGLMSAEDKMKLDSVESTANSAKSAAETAQTAATSAQETANSARATATAASAAAREAKTAAGTAQATATDVNTKITELSLGLGKTGVISQVQTWTQAADNGYDYVMSGLVRGVIPQANIDLFTSAGAIFNEESGYFELNGLTDISYEEMLNIYNVYNPNPWNGQQGMLVVENTRTFLPTNNSIISSVSLSGLRLCYTLSDIEAINMIRTPDKIQFNNLQLAWFQNFKLKNIQNIIDVSKVTKYDQAFEKCYSLVDVRLWRIMASVSFKDCARLSNSSILYMINNEAATSPITITLHADVYNRCMANEDILAALESHTNISLARL